LPCRPHSAKSNASYRIARLDVYQLRGSMVSTGALTHYEPKLSCITASPSDKEEVMKAFFQTDESWLGLTMAEDQQ
jgi:hypothetical protein